MYKINEICKGGRPLPLETDGKLRVIFLGVGSAFTRRKRQSNFLIIQGNHHTLVDCCTLGPLALEDMGLSVSKVQVYLPTQVAISKGLNGTVGERFITYRSIACMGKFRDSLSLLDRRARL